VRSERVFGVVCGEVAFGVGRVGLRPGFAFGPLVDLIGGLVRAACGCGVWRLAFGILFGVVVAVAGWLGLPEWEETWG